ncbi:hypothetical protein SDC9_158329 [bioreactor metagenome]|uniref:Uncharacterized protein n=1 Tax=bioreactor metagenome TaxID=1076179 RepID=A0A645F9H8_9ZZZZ
MIGALQVQPDGFHHRVGQIQHHHRAESDIGEPFDGVASFEVVNEPFSQAAVTRHAPAVKVDPGDERIGVGFSNRLFPGQFGAGINAQRIGNIRLFVIAHLPVKDGIGGDLHHLDAMAGSRSGNLARQLSVDLLSNVGAGFAIIHVGDGRAMDNDLRFMLCDQFFHNAWLGQFSFDAFESNPGKRLRFGNTNDLMLFAIHSQRQVET